MINKDFKRDYKIYGGEVNVIDTLHFSLDIDKDFLGLSVDLSLVYRMIYIKIFCFVIRIY